MTAVDAGLCSTCEHRRELRSARGSTFTLCQLHDHDPRFPKYPRLPVIRCEGYRPDEPGEAGKG